jgi:hypothetical protein
MVSKICKAQGKTEHETGMECNRWQKFVADLCQMFGKKQVEEAVDLFIERYSNRDGGIPKKWPRMLRWWCDEYYSLKREAPSKRVFKKGSDRLAVFAAERDSSKVDVVEDPPSFVRDGETMDEALDRLMGPVKKEVSDESGGANTGRG